MSKEFQQSVTTVKENDKFEIRKLRKTFFASHFRLFVFQGSLSPEECLSPWGNLTRVENASYTCQSVINSTWTVCANRLVTNFTGELSLWVNSIYFAFLYTCGENICVLKHINGHDNVNVRVQVRVHVHDDVHCSCVNDHVLVSLHAIQ